MAHQKWITAKMTNNLICMDICHSLLPMWSLSKGTLFFAPTTWTSSIYFVGLAVFMSLSFILTLYEGCSQAISIFLCLSDSFWYKTEEIWHSSKENLPSKSLHINQFCFSFCTLAVRRCSWIDVENQTETAVPQPLFGIPTSLLGPLLMGVAVLFISSSDVCVC